MTTTATLPSTATTGTEKARRIYHPLQKDYVTFLETCEETEGRRTLVEVELAPGGGNDLHYHRTYSERFEVLEGELHVQVDGRVFVLVPGQAATAPANALHRFWNSSDQPTRFLVELDPGNSGFEHVLRIVYGLARDGRVTGSGIPKNLLHMALIVEMGEVNVPGFFSAIAPVLKLLARYARSRGVEEELLNRYCR